jgi:pimeloyl-ACP methyl ester carboxylesterase
MPLLDLNGRGLYYERAGSGASVLVFLHGGLIDSRLWDPQFKWFAERAAVIRLDLAGNGRSEPPEDGYSGIEALSDVLDMLEVERATMIGLSGGARIAVDFAISDPSRMERLVAVAPGLSGYERWALPQEQLSALIHALRLGDRDLAAEAWLNLWAPVTKAALLELGRENAESLFAGQLIDLDPPAVGRLAEISAPTLVVVGDKDLADIQTIADLIVAGVPGAEKHVIEGADHFPNVDDPAAFNEVVARFLGLAGYHASGGEGRRGKDDSATNRLGAHPPSDEGRRERAGANGDSSWAELVRVQIRSRGESRESARRWIASPAARQAFVL